MPGLVMNGRALLISRVRTRFWPNACIRYLCSTDFGSVDDFKARRSEWRGRLRDSPFFEYAAGFWPDHVNTGIPEQLHLEEAIQLYHTWL